MHLFQSLVILADPDAAHLDDDDRYHDDGSSMQNDRVPHLSNTEQCMAFLVNVVGVYVGLMGFRASTTISRVAATKYFHGLMLLTVLIMISGVLRLVQARKDGFISGSEKMMMGAIILVGIPGMLWSFCVYQAGMFRAALIRTDLGT